MTHTLSQQELAAALAEDDDIEAAISAQEEDQLTESPEYWCCRCGLSYDEEIMAYHCCLTRHPFV